MFFQKKNEISTCKKEKHQWVNFELKAYPHKQKKAEEFIENLMPEIDEFLQTVSVLKDENITLSFVDDRADDEISDYTGEFFGRTVPQDSGASYFYKTRANNSRVIVNLYNTASIVHEFGHILDVHSDGDDKSIRWSERDDFKPILEEYRARLNEYQAPEWYKKYCSEPTEVFARLFQEYHKDLFSENDLTEMWSYEVGEIVAAELYKDKYQEITAYFDTHLPEVYAQSERYRIVESLIADMKRIEMEDALTM